MNIGNKSILAKLLATENVSVEHKNVRTAYFDLKERKVVLPVFKKMSSDLYDLLIGHEVSHALNTPLAGWHDAASAKGRGFKSFLNIVEDARIEADIKRRYPGLVKNFYKGYRELYEMDFFGLDRDINEYPLIDRINLHFKVGMFAAVDFSSEELVYVDKVAKCETWEDVVTVATELYELSKFEEAMSDMADDIQAAQQGEIGEDTETEEVEQNSNNGEEKESTDNDSDSEEAGDETVEEEIKETFASDSTEAEDDFEPASITDINYRKSEEQLIQSNAPEYHYGKFPKLDYKKWIDMDPWASWEPFEFKRKVKNDEFGYTDVELDYETSVDELQNNFNMKNRAYINMMVQQFEAKRKAAQFAKARENKTGDLNMNKLWATKLTEDVFLSNTVMPDGKNHGMLMVIDFSGSMYDKMAQTIEQLLIQVAFCKKVNIPFEVYSFTNYCENEKMKHLVKNQREGNLKINDDELTIMKLFSSDMSATKYKQAVRNMIAMSACYPGSKHLYEDSLPFAWNRSLAVKFWLGGTPLAETVMVLRDRAIDFRNENKIDVLNTLFLTDGSNTGDIVVPGRNGSSFRNEGIVITENGVTTSSYNTNKLYSVRFADIVCEALIKHYDKTTGSRTINYYLDNPSKSDLKQRFVNLYGWGSEGKSFDTLYKRDYLKEGFIQLDGLNGFPTAYIVRSRDLGNLEDLEVKGDSKGDLVRGFKKFQGSKSKSRKFLNNFIEKIA
ncbi:hypothetical protein OAA34_00620 [bacterium]|nr:hypothetical protein [bacterium]